MASITTILSFFTDILQRGVALGKIVFLTPIKLASRTITFLRNNISLILSAIFIIILALLGSLLAHYIILRQSDGMVAIDDIICKTRDTIQEIFNNLTIAGNLYELLIFPVNFIWDLLQTVLVNFIQTLYTAFVTLFVLITELIFAIRPCAVTEYPLACPPDEACTIKELVCQLREILILIFDESVVALASEFNPSVASDLQAIWIKFVDCIQLTFGIFFRPETCSIPLVPACPTIVADCPFKQMQCCWCELIELLFTNLINPLFSAIGASGAATAIYNFVQIVLFLLGSFFRLLFNGPVANPVGGVSCPSIEVFQCTADAFGNVDYHVWGTTNMACSGVGCSLNQLFCGLNLFFTYLGSIFAQLYQILLEFLTLPTILNVINNDLIGICPTGQPNACWTSTACNTDADCGNPFSVCFRTSPGSTAGFCTPTSGTLVPFVCLINAKVITPFNYDVAIPIQQFINDVIIGPTSSPCSAPNPANLNCIIDIFNSAITPINDIIGATLCSVCFKPECGQGFGIPSPGPTSATCCVNSINCDSRLKADCTFQRCIGCDFGTECSSGLCYAVAPVGGCGNFGGFPPPGSAACTVPRTYAAPGGLDCSAGPSVVGCAGSYCGTMPTAGGTDCSSPNPLSGDHTKCASDQMCVFTLGIGYRCINVVSTTISSCSAVITCFLGETCSGGSSGSCGSHCSSDSQCASCYASTTKCAPDGLCREPCPTCPDCLTTSPFITSSINTNLVPEIPKPQQIPLQFTGFRLLSEDNDDIFKRETDAMVIELGRRHFDNKYITSHCYPILNNQTYINATQEGVESSQDYVDCLIDYAVTRVYRKLSHEHDKQGWNATLMELVQMEPAIDANVTCKHILQHVSYLLNNKTSREYYACAGLYFMTSFMRTGNGPYHLSDGVFQMYDHWYQFRELVSGIVTGVLHIANGLVEYSPFNYQDRSFLHQIVVQSFAIQHQSRQEDREFVETQGKMSNGQGLETISQRMPHIEPPLQQYWPFNYTRKDGETWFNYFADVFAKRMDSSRGVLYPVYKHFQTFWQHRQGLLKQEAIYDYRYGHMYANQTKNIKPQTNIWTLQQPSKLVYLDVSTKTNNIVSMTPAPITLLPMLTHNNTHPVTISAVRTTTFDIFGFVDTIVNFFIQLFGGTPNFDSQAAILQVYEFIVGTPTTPSVAETVITALNCSVELGNYNARRNQAGTYRIVCIWNQFPPQAPTFPTDFDQFQINWPFDCKTTPQPCPVNCAGGYTTCDEIGHVDDISTVFWWFELISPQFMGIARTLLIQFILPAIQFIIAPIVLFLNLFLFWLDLASNFVFNLPRIPAIVFDTTNIIEALQQWEAGAPTTDADIVCIALRSFGVPFGLIIVLVYVLLGVFLLGLIRPLFDALTPIADVIRVPGGVSGRSARNRLSRTIRAFTARVRRVENRSGEIRRSLKEFQVQLRKKKRLLEKQKKDSGTFSIRSEMSSQLNDTLRIRKGKGVEESE